MPGGGRQDVATGEGRPGRGQLVVGVVERHHRPGPPAIATAGASRPLSGPSSTPPATSTPSSRRLGADAGVDDGHDDAVVGQVLHGPHEEQRTRAHVVRGDVVAHVEDPDVGREPEHHGLAHADELVGQAVVGRERDAARSDAEAPDDAQRLGSRLRAGPALSAGLRVAGSQIRVDVDVAHAERASDADCGQFARFDDAIDRHGRHSHEIGDFLNCQESRRGE